MTLQRLARPCATRGQRWLAALLGWGALLLAPAVPCTAGAAPPAERAGVNGARVINPDMAGLQALPGPTGAVRAWGTDATLWQRRAADARWEAEALPHSATLRAVADAALDPAEPRLVAAGDEGLLLHRGDHGSNWHAAVVPASTAGTQPSWSQLACHVATCRAVAAGHDPLLSQDAGATWQAERSPGAPGALLRQLVVSNQGHWWLASDHRLWHRAPDADGWQSLALPGPRAAAAGIEALAAEGDQLIVATGDGRLLTRAGAGASLRLAWRSPRGPFARLHAAGVAGAWVATGPRGACAWRPAPTQAWRGCTLPAGSSVRALAAAAPTGPWIAVLEDGRLLRTADQGRRWQVVEDGLPAPEPGLLEVVVWSPGAAGFVAAGAGGLLVHGDASGQHWQVVHEGPRDYVHDIVTTPQGLLAAGSHRLLARSADGGRSWRARRFVELDEPAFLNALHIDATSGAVVVAGGQGSVLFAPDGVHWRAHSSGHGHDHLGLIAEPRRPSVLLHGTGGAVMRVNLRSGALQREPLPTAAPVYAAFHGPDGEPWLLGGGPDTGGLLLRPADDDRWALFTLSPRRLRAGLTTTDGQAVVLAGDGGLLLRASAQGGFDRAAAWQPVAAPTSAHWQWLVDAGAAGLWLGGTNGALLRSHDGGQIWQAVPLPTASALRRPAHDPVRGLWWLPGRDGTLLRSADGGRHWERIALPTRAHFKGVHINTQDGSVLAHGERLVRVGAEPAP